MSQRRKSLIPRNVTFIHSQPCVRLFIGLVFLLLSSTALIGAGSDGLAATNPQRAGTQKRPAPSDAPAVEALQQQALAAFEEGQRAHESGDYVKAIEKYSEALDVIPQFPEALYQRGMARLASKQLDDAFTDLSTLIEWKTELLTSAGSSERSSVSSFFARAYSALADVLTERGERSKAELNYHRALELDPGALHPSLRLGTLLVEREGYSEAAIVLRSCVDSGRASAPVYSLLGYAYEKSNQLDLASSAYDQAIALEPRSLPARLRRSHLRALRQDYPGAVQDMVVVYEEDRSAANGVELGALYERGGNTHEAIRLYEQALEASPTMKEARSIRVKLVSLLLEEERVEEALNQARHVIKDYWDDADTLSRLGNRLISVDPSSALEAYMGAAKLDPKNVDTLVGLSAALLKLKRTEEAMMTSGEAVRLAPENYYAHSNLATALFQLKRFAEAADHFRWIIEHRPGTVIAYYFLGICHDKLTEYDSALWAYERFLELADASQYQMEIDNARFRLPGVRRMIEKGRGQRKKG